MTVKYYDTQPDEGIPTIKLPDPPAVSAFSGPMNSAILIIGILVLGLTALFAVHGVYAEERRCAQEDRV